MPGACSQLQDHGFLHELLELGFSLNEKHLLTPLRLDLLVRMRSLIDDVVSTELTELGAFPLLRSGPGLPNIKPRGACPLGGLRVHNARERCQISGSVIE